HDEAPGVRPAPQTGPRCPADSIRRPAVTSPPAGRDAMRIAVTGASGFVGGAVAAAAEERGWEVIRYGRRQLPGLSVWDLSAGQLTSPPEVDAVVHAGAHVADWGPPQLFHRVNVLGTEAVAATFPYARLVHVSSSSVYPWWQPCVDRPEDAVAG